MTAIKIPTTDPPQNEASSSQNEASSSFKADKAEPGVLEPAVMERLRLRSLTMNLLRSLTMKKRKTNTSLKRETNPVATPNSRACRKRQLGDRK